MPTQYTHSFSINIDGVTINGEVYWDSGKDIHLKVNGTTEAPLNLLDLVSAFFKHCGDIYSCAGEINNITINKK